MPSGYPLPGFILDPAALSGTATITNPAGVQPTIYSDPFGVSALTQPITVIAPRKVYVAGDGPWLVNGQSLALENNQVGTLTGLGFTNGPSVNVSDPLYRAVGDGVTDDTAAIQSAIKAAGALYASTGCPVRVVGKVGATYLCTYQATTYTFHPTKLSGTPALILRSGVVLDGLSLVFPTYVSGSPMGISDQGTAAAIQDWGIVNCKINGSASTSVTAEFPHYAIVIGNSSRFTIANNTISNWESTGVTAAASTFSSLSVAHGWIHNNLFTLIQGGAVRIFGGQDIHCVENICYLALNATYAAVSAPNVFMVGDTSGWVSRQIWITGNSVYDWGIGVTVGGVTSDIIVTDNYIHTIAGGANIGFTYNGTVTRGVISNNIVDNSQGSGGSNQMLGIQLIQLVATDLEIRGNIISMPGSAATSDAIDLDVRAGSARVSCVGNKITGLMSVSNSAINVPATAAGDTLTISDNEIDASGYSGTGLLGLNIASTGYTNVKVERNTLNGPYMSISGTARVAGNDITSLGTAQTALNILAAKCVVAGNHIFSGGYRGMQTGNSAANCVIADNIIESTVGYPLVVQGGATVVDGNTVINNSANPTYFEANASGNLVVNNIFTGTQTTYLTMIASTTTIVRGNIGPNPVGVVVVSVPATTVAVAAQYYDRTFYVTNGASSNTFAISGGPTITLASGVFGTIRVPAGRTLTPTYTSAPTWVVEGE